MAEKAISKEAMETLEQQGFVVIDGALSGQEAAKALKGCEIMQRSCSCVCVCACVWFAERALCREGGNALEIGHRGFSALARAHVRRRSSECEIGDLCDSALKQDAMGSLCTQPHLPRRVEPLRSTGPQLRACVRARLRTYRRNGKLQTIREQFAQGREVSCIVNAKCYLASQMPNTSHHALLPASQRPTPGSALHFGAPSLTG